MSTTTNGFNTQSSAVPAPSAKPVDSKTITGSYPGDHRAEAQGGTDPLKGNEAPVRSGDESEGA